MTRRTRLLVACCFLSIAVSRISAAWPFLITPQGFPNVEVALTAPHAVQDGVPPLMFRHVLVFDGERYQSRMAIAELESSFIRCGKNEFEWQRFGGGTAIIRSGEFVALGTRWTCSRQNTSGVERTTIRRADGEESHSFVGSHLESVQRGKFEWRFAHENGRLTEVVQVRPAPRPVFELLMRNPTWAVMKLGHETFELTYNAEGQLERCVDVAKQELVVGCTYGADHLLAELRVPGRAVHYRWDNPKWTTAYIRSAALAPVVASDDRFVYHVELDLNATTVHFADKRETVAGEWRVDPKSDGLTVKFDRGSPGDLR